jgi:hypothetical protein
VLFQAATAGCDMVVSEVAPARETGRTGRPRLSPAQDRRGKHYWRAEFPTTDSVRHQQPELTLEQGFIAEIELNQAA